MDGKLKELLENVNEKSLAEICIILSDKEKNMQDKNIARIKAEHDLNAQIPEDVLKQALRATTPKEVNSLVEGIKADKINVLNLAVLEFEIAKGEFRLVAMVRDQMELIVRYMNIAAGKEA
jgi:hypothetical protein